ncbi:MAG TPA: hypothetical protein VEL28_21440 [Candidatus Binatia bacterium]|nr:hypothetical protein [Candidatus Binatia bacterium]
MNRRMLRPWPRRWRAAAAAALLCGPVPMHAPPASACDLCAIYTGTIMQEDKTGFFLGAAEQYTSFGTLRLDGEKAPNPQNEWMRSSITQLAAGYRFAPWVSLQVNVPLISREYRRLEEGIAERGDEGGLGDISVLLRLAPLSRAYTNGVLHAEVMTGLKLPTGDTDRLEEELGEEEEEARAGAARATPANAAAQADPPVRPHHEGHDHPSGVHGHDLSLGSGSVDGVFGLVLYASWKRLFFSAHGQYFLRGNGDFAYEYDDDLLWAAGPGIYPLLGHQYTTALQLVVSGETKGNDKQAGVRLDDTAITALFVGPGLSLTWSHSLTVDLAADIPVIQNNSGLQIVPDYRLRAGLTWHF